MDNISVIKDQQRQDQRLAAEVMAFAAHSQFDHNGFIKDDKARYEAILEAAKECPLFEGAPDQFTGAVASAWASGMAEYANTHGRYPDAGLLANSYRACQRLLLESAPGKRHQGFSAPMFESAQQAMMEAVNVGNQSLSMADGTMHYSPGVMRLALFAALILPVALGATTADAVTFVPCERDESDVYKITQIAASNFGSYNKGDELDMQSAGVYAHFQRTTYFPVQPDGKLTVFNFTTKATESDPAGTNPTTRLNKDIPLRAGRTLLLINKIPARNYDDTHGKAFWGGTDAFGNEFSANVEIDYMLGEIEVKFTTPPKDGTKLAVTYELDVESMPEIIPLINQKMDKWTIKPSQYALAAEYTVQALMDAQREFGLDLSSQLFSGARNWLSHETDMKRLREILARTVYGTNVDLAFPNDKQLDAYLMQLKQILIQASSEMVNRTKTSGIRGGFAGQTVANFFKSLPASVWTPAPGYQESPYIQFAGTLFGYIRIYEVPDLVISALNADDLRFNTAWCLFYGRGENIGEAGFVSGDAVPAIPFIHPTTPGLVNRTTLWGSSINIVHPNQGYRYFTMVQFGNHGGGDYYDPLTQRTLTTAKVP